MNLKNKVANINRTSGYYFCREAAAATGRDSSLRSAAFGMTTAPQGKETAAATGRDSSLRSAAFGMTTAPQGKETAAATGKDSSLRSAAFGMTTAPQGKEAAAATHGQKSLAGSTVAAVPNIVRNLSRNARHSEGAKRLRKLEQITNYELNN